MDSTRSEPGTCANCGHAVQLAFCPACGQHATSRRRSVLTVAGDFLSEFFSLDGRHFRTFSTLLIPGRLTERYLQGKHASFVPPVRVYFVASLLFFLLVGFPAPDADNYNVWVENQVIGRDEPDPELGNLMLMKSDDSSLIRRMANPNRQATREKLLTMSAQEAVDRFFAGLGRVVPSALILFVPFLALALKLLYIRQNWFYVDHLVFALHAQSVLFLALVFGRPLNALGLAELYHGALTYAWIFLLVTPVYFVLALRRVYGQSWVWSVIKAVALCFLYLVIMRPIIGLAMVFISRTI